MPRYTDHRQAGHRVWLIRKPRGRCVLVCPYHVCDCDCNTIVSRMREKSSCPSYQSRMFKVRSRDVSIRTRVRISCCAVELFLSTHFSRNCHPCPEVKSVSFPAMWPMSASMCLTLAEIRCRSLLSRMSEQHSLSIGKRWSSWSWLSTWDNPRLSCLTSSKALGSCLAMWTVVLTTLVSVANEAANPIASPIAGHDHAERPTVGGTTVYPSIYHP